MKIEIEPARNGARVTVSEADECTDAMLYCFGDEDLDDLVGLLYDVKEQLEPSTSRYSERRIKISVVHGDKYECKNTNCRICE